MPAAAKSWARLAGFAVESDQPRVDGPFEDAQLARRAVRGFGIRPGRHAARGHFGILVRATYLGIIGPLLGAAAGSSAITLLKGVVRYSVPSTRIGVASKAAF